ncbi:MAG: hypothetical protein JRH20_05835 [Deltaproteobacteria bacterium]|nr:hypothetical protein [Deltaproteobacteria bacterium]
MRVFITSLGLCVVTSCTATEAPTLLSGGLRPRLAATKSPVYVLYPHLDQRIVAFSPEKTGDTSSLQHIARYFPDLWDPDITVIRDFAVDEARLYALASTREAADAARLHVVSLKTGALERRLNLPPSPQRLRWADDGRLLVGHATPPKGPPGRVSVVNTRTLEQERSIILQGATIDLVSFGKHAFVIERTERLIGANEVFATFQLLSIDLQEGKVLRRRAIPAGARELSIGPTGLLYVAHVSGVGMHSTDGRVSVFGSDSLRRVDQLPFEMSVRAMASDETLLVTSLLKDNGDAWFNATAVDHSTVFDFRFSELVTRQLAVIDGIAYIPLRQKNAFERVDLQKRARLPRVSLGVERHRDGIGLLRTRMQGAASKTQRAH